MRLSRSSLSVLLGASIAFFFVATVVMCFALVGLMRPRGLPGGGTPIPDAPPVPTAAGDAGPAPGDAATPTPFEIPTGACPGPDRMNILLLGLDNREHDYTSAVRSDSMQVVSADFRHPSAAVLGIPRDLWVALPNVDGVAENRINSAYVYGESRGLPGGGPQLAMDTVTLNFGIRLDRFIVVDFSAFVEAVDAVGGIDIEVPKPIVDDRYPADEGFGVITFSVPAGWQHMDGVTTLRYARTRHADNDFERIRRQQAVMFALRDKVLTPEILPKLPGLVQVMYGSVRTNLSLSEIAGLVCLNQVMDRSAIRTYVIDSNYLIPWFTDTGASVQIPNRDAIAPIVSEFNGQ